MKNITTKTPNTAKTHAKRIPPTYISRLSDDANDAIIASLISKKNKKNIKIVLKHMQVKIWFSNQQQSQRMLLFCFKL